MEENKNIHRLIDANLNRCREGLRVIEDALRFVLSDEQLAGKIRTVRHNSDKILRDFYENLISQRDILSDFGKQVYETLNKNFSEIIIANFKRAQEALRTLEEYCKTVYPKKSIEFKKQRFEIYNLEKDFFLKYKNRFFMKK
jgi:thiamine-phosphate pyrophosphorylase